MKINFCDFESDFHKGKIEWHHPIHGLYLVSSFDEDNGKWLGLETCYTPAECHQVIKRVEHTLGEILP